MPCNIRLTPQSKTKNSNISCQCPLRSYMRSILVSAAHTLWYLLQPDMKFNPGDIFTNKSVSSIQK